MLDAYRNNIILFSGTGEYVLDDQGTPKIVLEFYSVYWASHGVFSRLVTHFPIILPLDFLLIHI